MAILGSITINELQVLEVDQAPTVSGADADIGSIAIVTDGSKLFLKTGAGSTQWTPINSLERLEYSYRMTAIQNSTSTTYADVTELVTISLPVGFYIMNFYGIAQSTVGATGIGVRLGAGTAALGTTTGLKWHIAQGGNGTDRDFQYDQVTPTDNVTSTLAPTANANFLIKGEGIFEITTAGTVAIQFRSETGNSVSLRPLSSLFVKQL
jgi:hypothetical protein